MYFLWFNNSVYITLCFLPLLLLSFFWLLLEKNKQILKLNWNDGVLFMKLQFYASDPWFLTELHRKRDGKSTAFSITMCSISTIIQRKTNSLKNTFNCTFLYCRVSRRVKDSKSGPKFFQKSWDFQQSTSGQTFYSLVTRRCLTVKRWSFSRAPVHFFYATFTTVCRLQGGQHLSGGVFKFGRLWVAGETGQRGNPGVCCRALALQKHGVQTSNFGSKKSVNTVKYSKEVWELQLLKEKREQSCLNGDGF